MKLRRFTDAGVAKTRAFLAAVKESNDVNAVTLDGQPFTRAALLSSSAYSEAIPALADIDLDETRTFDTTFAFCEYFDSLIHDHNPQTYREDVGFWTWLAMVYLPQLVKHSGEDLKVGDITRYMFKPNDYKVYYRHLLAGPFAIYWHYSVMGIATTCKALLWHNTNSYGDVYEQIASRQGLVQNPVFVDALNKLYFDEDRQVIKPGAGGPKAATARRLVDAIDQLQRTRDFYDLEDVTEFLRVLPREFDKFNPLRKGSV